MEQILKLKNIFNSYKYEVHPLYYALKIPSYIIFYALTLLSFAYTSGLIAYFMIGGHVNIYVFLSSITVFIISFFGLSHSFKKLKNKMLIEYKNSSIPFVNVPSNMFDWGELYYPLKRDKTFKLLEAYSVKDYERLINYSEKEKDRRDKESFISITINSSIHGIFIGIFIAIVFSWIQSSGKDEIYKALPTLFKLNSLIYLFSSIFIIGGIALYYRFRFMFINDFIAELEQLEHEKRAQAKQPTSEDINLS